MKQLIHTGIVFNFAGFNLLFGCLPEPSTFALVGSVAVALLFGRRRK